MSDKIVKRGAGDARLWGLGSIITPAYRAEQEAKNVAATRMIENVTKNHERVTKKGRPVTGNALTSAQRQKAYRERRKAAKRV